MSSIVISTTPADSTGSGGRVGVYGNVACLDKAGFPCLNIVISKPVAITQQEYEVVFLDPESNSPQEITEQLQSILLERDPKVIWLHHYWIWDYFEPCAKQYPFVVLSGDPDLELLMLRQETKAQKTGITAQVLQYLRYQKQLQKAKKREKYVFHSAQKYGGILACWCPSSVPTIMNRTGIKTYSCPLAFPDWGQRERVEKRNILMLGNLNGGHTRNGLKFFMNQIWEDWKKLSKEVNFPIIRMVGGGKMPESIQVPQNSNVFERVGFVEDLEVEWENSLAMLVPVETNLGFRTRIVESWSKGVPVLAHPSAEVSLPEGKNGIHYLSFKNANELRAAVERLQNPAFYQKMVEAARLLFLQFYELNGAYQRYQDLSKKAISNRERTAQVMVQKG